MSGQIHGIISREQAWCMWGPYGQRVSLDGAIDPGTLDHADALRILFGASKTTQSELYGYWYDEKDDREWYVGLRDLDLTEETEFVDTLVTSALEQQKRAEQLRNEALQTGLPFMKKVGAAAMQLAGDRIFTPHQLEQIQSWLIGPDGNPFVQYTPMSQLESGRLARKSDGG